MMETASKVAEEVVEKFSEEWEPLMENVKEAAEVFDNLEGVLVKSYRDLSPDQILHICDDASWQPKEGH